MGMPIPNAWLGNLKNVDLIAEFGGTGGVWKAFADGVEALEFSTVAWFCSWGVEVGRPDKLCGKQISSLPLWSDSIAQTFPELSTPHRQPGPASLA